ncbi:hypothetical protein FOM02_30595 [Bradyrhizobium sp. SEMIA]|nr:hypothetical protein FOM02_30595 [Bradyrhizobium sp. SEMIA]
MPDSLPASLRRLDVRGNQLTTLPELPIELRGLDASSNRLTSLPAVLPAELELLDLSHNQLQELPEVLRASLQFLRASHNQLTNLLPAPSARTFSRAILSSASMRNMTRPSSMRSGSRALLL